MNFHEIAGNAAMFGVWSRLIESLHPLISADVEQWQEEARACLFRF